VEALRDLVINTDRPDPAVTDRLRALLPTLDRPVARYMCLSALAEADARDVGFSGAVLARFSDAASALEETPYRGLKGGAAANLAQMLLYADRPGEALARATLALDALRDGSSELLAWVHVLRASAAASLGRVDETAASLRNAVDLGVMRGGSVGEAMVATIAGAAASNAPLLAARAFGAASTRIAAPDRALAERFLAPARRATNQLAIEIARRDGEQAGVDAVMEEVLAHLESTRENPTSTAPLHLRHGTLTPREVEVLGLIGGGKNDGEIAAALSISRKTASVHVSNAKAKLGLSTRLEAALWARDRGIAGRGPA
jgi:DNA-binding NarL/FixJ family response regulator